MCLAYTISEICSPIKTGGEDMEKRYNRGYIAGVFDMFHTGHLNLIENAKSMCEHLTVGVLTDELVIFFKNKPPYIRDFDRHRIVKAIRTVDDAVLVDVSTIDKISAWNKYHFDCLFSGDDWKNEPSWIADKKRLQELGSDIIFFPYTQNISSTEIKEKLKKDNYKGTIIWGASQNGKKALEYYGEKSVVGFIDNDNTKKGSMTYGKPVFDFQKIKNILSDYQIVIAIRNPSEVEEILKTNGISNYSIFNF